MIDVRSKDSEAHTCPRSQMTKVFQIRMVTCVKCYLVIELGKDWEWLLNLAKWKPLVVCTGRK